MSGSSDHISWGKLILFIWLSVKQNIGYVWLVRPHAIGKLILLIRLSVKQNICYVWLFRPHVLGKLNTFYLVRC